MRRPLNVSGRTKALDLRLGRLLVPDSPPPILLTRPSDSRRARLADHGSRLADPSRAASSGSPSNSGHGAESLQCSPHERPINKQSSAVKRFSAAADPSHAQAGSLGFNLYLVFTVSWFLHMGSRLPVLGAIRFDLLLVAALAAIAVGAQGVPRGPLSATDKWLRILITYALLTVPFVEWPGSVIRHGLEALIKAAVFYYFTIAFVDTEARLRKFLVVFSACQLFRVMEPLYLHVTEGYWGSTASMANWETLDRLSGAPSDIVNPNGLAFVICTVLPFLYFGASLSWRFALVAAVGGPLSIYALMLTGSRTGFLGLLVIAAGILIKSRQRAVFLVSAFLVGVGGFPMLSADMQDRYLSIIGMGEKNEGTAEGRWTGVMINFEVAMRRPLFGHGLGTSREANANFGKDDQPAHNLYAEAAQELGFIGMILFVFFMKTIVNGFAECKRVFSQVDQQAFLTRVVDALQVWLWLNIVFSFASYGVTSFEWYLLAGLSVVSQRLATHGSSLVERYA